MNLGLHSRLLFSLLALFFIGSVLLGIVLLGDAEDRLNQFRETQAKYQAKTLAEGSLDALVTEDFELLERWVHSAMPSEEYAYAALVRPNGQVLTHTDLTLIGEQVNTQAKIVHEVIRQSQYHQRPIKEVIHPAVIGDQVLANAHVAYYIDTESVLRRDTITRIVGILLLSLVLLVGASHFVTRSVTVPIQRLKQSVSHTSLDEVVKLDGLLTGRSDEVGELARSFRKVSESLVESHNELTESLLANKAIVDTSIDGIIVIDDKGIVESINFAGENIFGYSAAEIVGKNINMLMPEPYHSHHGEYLAAYNKSGNRKIVGARREVTGLRKDGSKVPLELAIGEIACDGGKKFAGTVRDITARYEYEQALVIAKDAAEEGNRAKTEFLSTISHELRTPMNGILGAIDLMDLEDLSVDLKNYVDMAQRSTSRLMELVDNILDFSDLDSGHLELDLVEFDIGEMAVSIVESHTANNHDTSVELTFEVDDQLPKTLIGDASRLRNVLDHILGNAVKFTKEGQIVLKVLLEETRNNAAAVRVEVSDTGIGIEQDDQSRIFNIFTQVDGSFTREYQGTGIGLTLCKKIVEAMGGEIGVVSEPDVGSTFWFTVELESGSDAQPAPKNGAKTKTLGNESMIGSEKDEIRRRVLIVEDDDMNQQIIAIMMKRMGFAYDVVANGQEAIDVIQQNHYDVVLMDCQMPVMNGFEATQKIRELESGFKHTPIIAVTANAMKSDREKCLSCGMDDYVSKPVNKEVLATTINAWINAA